LTVIARDLSPEGSRGEPGTGGVAGSPGTRESRGIAPGRKPAASIHSAPFPLLSASNVPLHNDIWTIRGIIIVLNQKLRVARASYQLPALARERRINLCPLNIPIPSYLRNVPLSPNPRSDLMFKFSPSNPSIKELNGIVCPRRKYFSAQSVIDKYCPDIPPLSCLPRAPLRSSG
jgi:hypothetical protein